MINAIRVSFSRQASDGNYGSETVRCELELLPEDGLLLDPEAASAALASCRQVVHEQLAQSPNWSVRHAIELPKQNPPLIDRTGQPPDWELPPDPDPEDLPL